MEKPKNPWTWSKGGLAGTMGVPKGGGQRGKSWNCNNMIKYVFFNIILPHSNLTESVSIKQMCPEYQQSNSNWSFYRFVLPSKYTISMSFKNKTQFSLLSTKARLWTWTLKIIWLFYIYLRNKKVLAVVWLCDTLDKQFIYGTNFEKVRKMMKKITKNITKV